jgi:hypothetical protein
MSNPKTDNLIEGLAALVAILIILIVSFLGTAFFVWVVTWAFSLEFSWKIAVGSWFLIGLANSIFSK